MSTDPKLPEEFILEIMKEQVKLVIILAILSLVCVFEPIYALDTNKTVVASDKLGTPQVSAAKTEIKSTAANSTEINKSNISTPAKGEISTDKNEEKKSKVSGGSADPWSNDADNFDEYFAEVVVNDPYEKFNRVMFAFNDKLDRFIIRPIAIGYNTVLPQPVINSVDNFFANIITIATVMDDTLQGNFYQASSDAWRFIINSTIGIGGIFDVATHFGLLRNDEDLGLTLAKWGYKDSTYLVLPFFGPTTIRDVVNIPESYYLGYYPHIKDVALRNYMFSLKVINTRALLLDYEGLMKQVALDPYIFLRSTYVQNRNYKIERNNRLNDPYTAAEIATSRVYDYLDQ